MNKWMKEEAHREGMKNRVVNEWRSTPWVNEERRFQNAKRNIYEIIISAMYINVY